MVQTVRLIVFYHEEDQTEYHSVGRNKSELYTMFDVGNTQVIGAIGTFTSPMIDRIPSRCYCSVEALKSALCGTHQPTKIKSYATDIKLTDISRMSDFRKTLQ